MENQRAHKYYCARCDRYLFGESRAHLATAVNYHAMTTHPSDFANWTPDTIITSCNYEGVSGPLPQYLTPHGTTSKAIPSITDEDRAMLKAGNVSWD